MTSSAFRAVAPVSRFVRLSRHSRAHTHRKPENRTLRRRVGVLQEYATQSGCVFHKSAVERILRNYAYTGNLLLQTKFRENHLTKVTRKNQGELPQYHATDTHEAIIPLETFNAVQAEIRRRKEKYLPRVPSGEIHQCHCHHVDGGGHPHSWEKGRLAESHRGEHPAE